jgi:hypothetical protein
MSQRNENSKDKVENNKSENVAYNAEDSQPLTRKEKVIWYFKKLGWFGFFFFLGKGLMWLIIPYLAAKGLIDCKG